ncbi:hypothetical protein [Pseudaquidulcibacter saccharophilus]|uniref:hypothetical protein n=1 Tax=Pseudaquidulcibacter saccharophilus TaxID=2831900 RepID=UPI001EFF1C26|nr:hypothetical protein [Pseudaquidulcibacter saccharophilus]
MKSCKPKKIEILYLIGLLSTISFCGLANAEPLNAGDYSALNWANSQRFACSASIPSEAFEGGYSKQYIQFAIQAHDDMTATGIQRDTINVRGSNYKKDTQLSGNVFKNSSSLGFWVESHSLVEYDPLPDGMTWGDELQMQIWINDNGGGNYSIQGQLVRPSSSRINFDYCIVDN